MLAGIIDPRDPRGVRHPLLAVLGVAVVTTLAGAVNYRELGSVAADLPQRLLRLLDVRWDRGRRRWEAPSAGTLRRVLIELDADELDAVGGAWLREHASCDREGWAIALDGKDLHGSWSDDGRLVLFSRDVRLDPLGGVRARRIPYQTLLVGELIVDAQQVDQHLPGLRCTVGRMSPREKPVPH
ncbi:MAG: transposase family protein [Actinoallomurus sp.]